MVSLKGTQTHKNLMRAFAGESQARNRYNFYEGIARKQGYPLIADVFKLTADQERMHGKIFFQYLAEEFNGEEIEIDATYPVDLYQENTVKNLLASVTAENHEHEEVYPEFAKIAKEEGFPQIAATFNMIAKIEETHAKRFAMLAKEFEEETLFKKETPIAWECQVCGHIHYGVSAPALCPVCKHPKGYFKAQPEETK
ncbi:MAG: rubrerythrin family protein [Turicibacter sp.]|nr:rubrerythrin family protein [Turicibacter sp.]